jgi:hypothetical protein
MKNNGKMTVAFLVVGLLGLIAGGGGIAVIYLAGDFDQYYNTYPYQYYLIAVAAIALLAFLLACCFAAGLSSSNNNKYRKLIETIKTAEEAQAAAEQKAAEAAAERFAPEKTPAPPAEEQKAAPAAVVPVPAPVITVIDTEAAAALQRIKSDALELKALVEKSVSPLPEAPDAGDENADRPKLESLINEIDDIAFRAHLLSLNVAIETSNAGDSDGCLSSIAEDVRAIENKSAVIASECKAVFTVERDTAKETEAAPALVPEITAVIERIITAAEGGIAPQPVSPIDPSVSGGLFG